MLQKKRRRNKNNGTDICWKQILNNQNCCKSCFFFSFSHTGTWTWNNRGGGRTFLFCFFFLSEIYEELAYNRKNLLCTHPTNKQTCHSQPGSLHQHPWGDCTSWGGGNRNSTWSGFLFVFFFSLSLSLLSFSTTVSRLPPPNHLINHLLSFKNLFFWFAGYNAK